MPHVKRLIFLKDKSGGFRLRDDIKSFGYDERLGQYFVYFKKGNNYLHYNPINVDVAEFVKQLDPPFRVLRRSDGEVFSHVLGVRVFEGKRHKAYRIIYENGTANNYPADYVNIEEHIDDSHSISVWEYLNEVARYNVIPVDDDKTVSLADKYAKMGFIAKGSLMDVYLNVESYKNPAGETSSPIFPFGCNRSQYWAVKNALENRISVIQGPPGTGKTQTVLNVLANLLLYDKTVQIVSNNNSAVENVKEKLEHEGIDFLCAQLGRASNKKAFIEHQTGLFPDMRNWKINNAESVKREAISLSKELQELYKCQEKLAVCSEMLSEYTRQVDSFPVKWTKSVHISTDKLEKYLFKYRCEIERRQRISFFTRIMFLLHRLPVGEDALDCLQYILACSKKKQMEKKCREYNEAIKQIGPKSKRLRDISMLVLKNHLFNKYGKEEKRDVYTQEDLYMKSREFLEDYPIVLSTTFSATSNINSSHKFDYLIMDEASQVDVAAGALALTCARNAVIVGDIKQLPNVVDTRTEEIVDSIFAKYGIPEAYRYSTNSFLSSICRHSPNIPQTLLKEHYRCDPLIIGFCSKQFYNGELIPMKKGDTEFPSIRVVRTVRGNHARGTVNMRQVETIVHEIIPELEEQFTDIGIIAPYNAQVDALHDALRSEGKNYEVATVHKFQGRENDAIVLSTVDNQIQEFTDDPHLLNVAVSRAKKQFTLVVSAGEQPDSNIQDLIDYIEYYRGKSEESQVSSIFDLLYADYTQELLDFYKAHRRVSQYDSENLAYWTIHDTLKENKLDHLGLLMHYPLRHLVTSASVLSDAERTYANHSWTHIDFLVYDMVSHKAKLAIEVDGTQFHRADSDQGRRDLMKDSILSEIGVPLLRLSTAGSQEKRKIAFALTGFVQDE